MANATNSSAMAEAGVQLRRYLADDYLQRQGPDIAYHGPRSRLSRLGTRPLPSRRVTLAA